MNTKNKPDKEYRTQEAHCPECNALIEIIIRDGFLIGSRSLSLPFKFNPPPGVITKKLLKELKLK